MYGEGEPRNETSDVSNTSGFTFLAIEGVESKDFYVCPLFPLLLTFIWRVTTKPVVITALSWLVYNCGQCLPVHTVGGRVLSPALPQMLLALSLPA